jgi:hypothetical protein
MVPENWPDYCIEGRLWFITSRGKEGSEKVRSSGRCYYDGNSSEAVKFDGSEGLTKKFVKAGKNQNRRKS